MPAFARRITGSSAVIQVLTALGQPTATAIAASTNFKLKQMWQFATEVGQELAAEHEWSFLRRELTLTLNGSATYNLPDDFERFIGSAGWNRTTTFPVVGDANEPQWQCLKAQAVLGELNLVYRLREGQIEFLEDPGGNQQVVLSYRSIGWVEDGSAPFDRRDNLEDDADIVLFDRILYKCALQRRWLIENRFDASEISTRYAMLLESAKAKDSTSQTISLTPQRGVPFLSIGNAPETGYGS